MERLTFDGNFCDIAQCRAIPCPYDKNCTQKQVWERLRQYEDTGLSPIACKEAHKIESGLSVDGYSISRMVELMVADVNGKILRLPCKPGDRVFAVGKQQIVECKVDSIYLDKRRHGVCVTFNCVSCPGCPFYTPLSDPEGDFRCAGELNEAEIDFDAFGKTVFPTYKEAENALRKAQESEVKQ